MITGNAISIQLIETCGFKIKSLSTNTLKLD
jgi:hypothetical protein